jgi:hypothetical protein
VRRRFAEQFALGFEEYALALTPTLSLRVREEVDPHFADEILAYF